MSPVQLGFVEAAVPGEALLFERSNWRDEWDGGLAGGAPMPLIPGSAPAPCCRRALFLAQVYAPLDEPPSAFHRCLYVFECPDHGPSCSRQQIARENEFYHGQEDRLLLLRERPPFEIVVEAEPEQDEKPHQRHIVLDEPEPLPETDHDPVYIDFLTTLARAPSQVLRYDRDGHPLWISNQTPGDIPRCPRCGAHRRFEFQLLPQLLYYLKLGDACDFGTLAVYTCSRSCGPHDDDDDDGGRRHVAAAAAAARSASSLPEFVFRQPPVDSG